MDLKNTTVLITGAGSGMGAETARYLASTGAKLALMDKNKASVQALAAEVKGVGFGADVSDSEQIKDVLEKITSVYGAPRICVQCAGILHADRVVSRQGAMPLADFEKVIQVNLIGTFNVLRLVAEKMIELAPIGESNERGVIINTASIAAFEGQIGQAAYSASKGGVVAMTLPVARELSKFGVRVMTIAPGIMETPMISGLTEKVKERLIADTVFPKRLGKAGEFARLVKEISENILLNGEVIRLDGGMRLG